MNRLSFVGASLLGAVVFALTFPADAKLERDGDAKVTFHATGPAGMSIEGTTSDLQVSDDGTTVVIKVPTASLSTGLGLRDRHMRDKYLEVQKYPYAELRVPRSALQIPADGASSRGNVHGKLTLHGQTHDQDFRYAAAAGQGRMNVNGSFHVLMTDYGIEVPSYMGVKVKPNVDIDASFTAKDK